MPTRLITLKSYGAKHNLQDVLGKVDKVFSCHYIQNPWNVNGLKQLTGLDQEVQAFVEDDKNAKYIRKEALEYVHDGSRVLAFECYGGKHRSVAMVEIVRESLLDLGHKVQVNHLSLGVNK